MVRELIVWSYETLSAEFVVESSQKLASCHCHLLQFFCAIDERE